MQLDTSMESIFEKAYGDMLKCYSDFGYPAKVLEKWCLPERDLNSLLKQVVAREPKNILEIGTYVGTTTLLMALHTPEGTRIHSIDPNLPLESEMAAMRCEMTEDNLTIRTQELAVKVASHLGLADKIIFHAGGSTTDMTFATENLEPKERVPIIGPDVCRRYGPFDFIFIDGLHYEAAVFADLCLAAEHLSPEGMIAIHDCIGRWGSHVRRAVFRFLESHPEFRLCHDRYERLYYAMGYLTRCSSNETSSQSLPGDVTSLAEKGLLHPLTYEPFCAYLVSRFSPRRLIMIGEDHFGLIPRFLRLGVEEIYSLAPSPPDNSSPSLHHLPWDLASPNPHQVRGDLCLCLSVLDMLPPASEKHLLDACCSSSDSIVFSVSPPGELGHSQKNGRPLAYWVECFFQKNFLFHDDISLHLEPWTFPLSPHITKGPLLSAFGLHTYLLQKKPEIERYDLETQNFILQVCLDKERRISDLHTQLVALTSIISNNREQIDGTKIIEFNEKYMKKLIIDQNQKLFFEQSLPQYIRGAVRYVFYDIASRIKPEVWVRRQLLANSPYYPPDKDFPDYNLLPACHAGQNQFSLSKPLKIYQYIGSLSPGGAERQFANLTVGLKARGHKVMAYCEHLRKPEHCHYKNLLEIKGCQVAQLQGSDLQRGLLALRRHEITPALFSFIPQEIKNAVLRLTGRLLLNQPDVLHCWLDWCNCAGGWAGLLAGVPLIVLSLRNVNPSHFPYLYNPWMNSAYRFLANHPRVRLVANSILGGQDYARWIGVPADKITVIFNAVDTDMFSPQLAMERLRLRKKLSIPPETPVVIGIFRLSPEKQPLYFVKIINRLRQRLPDLRALHVGCGPMERDMRALMRDYNLDDCLKLLGRRNDVQGLLAASDALLLTSQHEGMPNVIMEAQQVGCPPVATRVGGVPDVVQDGITGFLHDPIDLEGMTENLLKLLTDADLHESMVKAGQDYIQREFPLYRLVEESLRVYDSGLRRK